MHPFMVRKSWYKDEQVLEGCNQKDELEEGLNLKDKLHKQTPLVTLFQNQSEITHKCFLKTAKIFITNQTLTVSEETIECLFDAATFNQSEHLFVQVV